MDEKDLTVSTEKDTSTDSSSETNQEADTQSSDGDNNQTVKKEPPFHEHPRWKEMLERDKTRESELSELREFRKKSEPLLSKFQPDDDVEVPAWFGGDKEAYKLYKKDLANDLKRAREEAVKDVETKTQREKEAIRTAQEHFEKSFEKIKAADPNVDRNRLLSVTEKFRLVDEQGRWNWEAGYEILKAQEIVKSKAKEGEQEAKSDTVKQIIAISKSEKGSDGKPKDYKTNEDFKKGRPW